jgi:hypothetical protein
LVSNNILIDDSVSPDNLRGSPGQEKSFSQPTLVIRKVQKRGSDASNQPKPLYRKRNSQLMPLNQDSYGTKRIHAHSSDSEGSLVGNTTDKKIALPSKLLKSNISSPVKDINEIAIGNVSVSDSDASSQKLRITNLVDNGKIVGKNKNAKDKLQESSGLAPKRVLVEPEEDAKKNNSSDEDEDQFDTPPPTIKISKKQHNGSSINLVIGGAKDQGKPS